MTWGSLLADQLEFYLQAHLLPRLDGLGDDEYLWRPTGSSCSVVLAGDRWTIETPGPQLGVPTIAWRLCHIAVSNLGTRVSAFFGDGSVPPKTSMFDPRHEPSVPGTAEGAVALLTATHERWRDGIAGLTDEQLLAPLGPAGGPFAADPMATLALHVNRETMHHGGEIGLLRDLYALGP